MIDGKKVLYLSLPISDRPIEEVKERAASYKLKYANEYPDYKICTPFDVVPVADMPYSYYMGRDIEFILQSADMVIFASDFIVSRGCMAEYCVVKTYGIRYVVEPTNRTENGIHGKINTGKTLLKSEIRNRILKRLRQGSPFVGMINIIVPDSIENNTVHCMTSGDPDTSMSIDYIVNGFMDDKFKFIEL